MILNIIMLCIKICDYFATKISFLKKGLEFIRDKIIFIVVAKYYKRAEKIVDNQNIENSHYIWTFWAQGIEKAPEIVRICIDKMKNILSEYKVIVIDMDNIKEYVNIPEYIYEKVEKNIITLTHFSDILRMNLLSKYGGIWIDSTVLLGENFNNFIEENKNMITITQENASKYISKGKWSAWLLGAKNKNPYFNTFKNFFHIYWKDNNKQICYFLIDYLLEYTYRVNSTFRKDINEVCKTNYSTYELNNKLNNICNRKEYEDYLNEHFVNKLTYKNYINLEQKDTFAYHIKRT